jgi:hypothetical protein
MERLYDDPAWLDDQYHKLDRSQREIARLAGCSQRWISVKMAQFHIPSRDRQQAASEALANHT